MTIEEFGAQLLRSKDLDPIYVMLHKAQQQKLMSYEQLCQWCLGYWCDYHAGVASRLSNLPSDRFWEGLWDVAINGTKRYPRGTERRHFRGQNAMNLVSDLLLRYKSAWQFVEYVTVTTPFRDVSKRVQDHTGFGPWIAFKIADMSERVLGCKIDFTDCELGVYKDPLKGARMACAEWGMDTAAMKDQECLGIAVSKLTETFGDEEAPPAEDRFIGIQEIETILCKWKSHRNGHYPVGKDSREIRHGLTGWGTLAEELKQYVPEAA